MIEIRRMLVAEEELKSLLVKLILSDDSSASHPAHGTVMNIHIINESPLTMQVFGQSSKGTQIAREVGEVEVMTAIIGYCLDNKIPLSRKAKKSVKKTKDGVALDMVISGD